MSNDGVAREIGLAICGDDYTTWALEGIAEITAILNNHYPPLPVDLATLVEEGRAEYNGAMNSDERISPVMVRRLCDALEAQNSRAFTAELEVSKWILELIQALGIPYTRDRKTILDALEALARPVEEHGAYKQLLALAKWVGYTRIWEDLRPGRSGEWFMERDGEPGHVEVMPLGAYWRTARPAEPFTREAIRTEPEGSWGWAFQKMKAGKLAYLADFTEGWALGVRGEYLMLYYDGQVSSKCVNPDVAWFDATNWRIVEPTEKP